MALQEGWVLPARNNKGGFSSKVTGSGGFCRWGTTRGGAFPTRDGGVLAGSRGWLCSVECFSSSEGRRVRAFPTRGGSYRQGMATMEKINKIESDGSKRTVRFIGFSDRTTSLTDLIPVRTFFMLNDRIGTVTGQWSDGPVQSSF